jgi:septal ring factor EnvC (AmiA/AmiB activator)
MKENASKKNGVPASPPPDLLTCEPPTGKPATTSKQKSGVGKRIMRWTLWLMIVFALGATAMAVLFYLPLQQKQTAIEANLTISSQKITADEKRIESLTAQRTDLEDTNKALQSQLDHANLRLALIRAKSDILAASLAISDNNPVGARLSLEKATVDLQILTSLVKDGSLSEVLSTIQGHLEQVKSKVNNDFQTAQPDLDILIDNLSSLEDALNN